jgi:hypothetical protein
MRYKIYILLILFVASCAPDTLQNIRSNAGNADDCIVFQRKAVHCLRNFLTGEDAGGTWQQVGTTPQDLSGLLIGENPCFEWSDKACGQYEFMYIVGDPCCYDTSYVRPLKCCLTIISNCE